MKYFKTKVDAAGIFDAKSNDLYERSIAEGIDLVNKLSAVDELTAESIRASVYLVSD